ncbi:unnamed protein product [Diabrotica balteata]|uniref:Peptidase S1 domain-containing protein n=1 Tax=Diabrotica balteata TaxID=107213 RepID=A0A9N9SQU3_DIABA|nr:unnamed protein product [Diabrotica balteata]
MTLDSKLRWKAHVKKKEELKIKFRKVYWLMGKKSTLSIYNKLLLYKQVPKPIWTYGIQLWGCTKESNIQHIQRYQNKVLRNIFNAPWYFRNCDLHRDLQIYTVIQTISKNLRIIGGTKAKIEDHPWMVSFLNASNHHNCGGSLINEDTVISAAHCFEDDEIKYAVVGVSNLKHNKIFIPLKKKAKLHEKYDPRSYNVEYDIAIVKVGSPKNNTI